MSRARKIFNLTIMILFCFIPLLWAIYLELQWIFRHMSFMDKIKECYEDWFNGIKNNLR